jgi:uncharacterized protein
MRFGRLGFDCRASRACHIQRRSREQNGPLEEQDGISALTHSIHRLPSRSRFERYCPMKLVRLSLLALILATSTGTLVGCAAESDEQDEVDPTDDELRSGKAGIETFVGQDGQFYFHLKGGNGEKLLSSEGYTTKQAMDKGVASVKENGSRVANYDVREALDGQSYFVLKAQNNKIIGSSETYVSRSNAERAQKRTARLFTNIKISEAPRQARFETFKSANDSQFYFQLRAKNGEIVLQSEGYEQLGGAVNGMAAVKTAALADSFQFATSQDGRVFFVLRAANNETVAVSETYATRDGAMNAAESIKNSLANTLPVVNN